MAQNTASLRSSKQSKNPTGRSKRLPGISRTPLMCIGCGGKKSSRELFCKSCKVAYRAARKREEELDEMFERAIA